MAFFIHNDDGVGPFTAGFFRAAVVIPEVLFTRLSRHDLRLVIRHELAHAYWRDPLVNSLVLLVRALLWPSLPLWYLERVLRLEREAAADRAALVDAPAPERTRLSNDYASSLIWLAKQGGTYSGERRCGFITGMVGKSELETRVRRLLLRPSKFSALRLSVAGSSMFAGLLLITLLPLASRGGAAVNVRPVSPGPAAMEMHEVPLSSRQIEGAADHVLIPRSTPTSGGRVDTRLTSRQQTRPPEASLDSSTETQVRVSARVNEQRLRWQPSQETGPEPGVLPSGGPAARNERASGELAAERDAAARELPARNAAWTREQNAAMNAEMSGARSAQPVGRQNTDQVQQKGRQRD